MAAEQGTAVVEETLLAGGENKDGSLISSTVSTPRRRRDSIMKQRSSANVGASREIVKKSVCFSTTPDLRITTADDCFKLMHEGTDFIKLRKADRQYLRTFYLTEQRDEITWYPTKKPAKARLRIAEIKEVRTGRNTTLFRSHEYAARYNEDCQFSIVFGADYTTLDLVARTPELANIWFAGLNTLLAQRNNSRRKLSVGDAAATTADIGHAKPLLRSISHTVRSYEDSDADSGSKAAANAASTQNGATTGDNSSLLRNGSVAHASGPGRHFPARSASLHDRPRKGGSILGGIRLDTQTSRSEPIGEDESESPIVLEGNALLFLAASSNGDSSAQVPEHDVVCTDCIGLRDRWLRDAFTSADTRHTGILRETEAIRAMKIAGFNVCPARIRRKIMELDAIRDEDERGLLNVDQFVKLCKEVFTRPDVYFLLTRYASNAEYLTLDELAFFLDTEQSVNLSRSEVAALIERFEPTRDGKSHMHIGIDGLTSYLSSPDCSLFDLRHSRVCQDMTQPLTHYFISASHNTYLIEDQLLGPCSVDGYIHALQRGCRYIEVDVFDGTNNEPIVTRIASKASKLTLNAALEAINKYAFVASEYPLIIALSLRCCLQQQVTVAQLFTKHFGSRLYTDALEDGSTQLPSPEALRRRVLVKSKRYDAATSASPSPSPCPVSSPLASTPSQSQPSSPEADVDIECGFVSSDYDSESEMDTQAVPHKEKHHRLCRQLSDLVTILRSTTFQGFDASYGSSSVCTLSEKSALLLSTTHGEQLVSLAKSTIICVSPDGTRTDSSNFAPHDFWACGCQIAALNWQSPGAPVDVNVGFFRQNGACGYVLKPAVMRDPIATFQPSLKNASPDITPKMFTIKLLSALQLPKPRGSTAKGDFIEPYIVIQTYGIAADCTQQRTRTLEYDGSASLVNESFEMLVRVPQLATIRFLILDDNSLGDDFIAQYSVPIDCIRTGYRHVPLYSYDGSPLSGAKLFVHVTVTSLDALASSSHGASRRKSISRLSNGMSVSMSAVGSSTNANSAASSVVNQPHVRSKSSSNAIRRVLRSNSSAVRTLVEPKPTGAKAVDELFVSIAAALHTAADRREAVNSAFTQLREACGLSHNASAKQCIRYFFNALQQTPNASQIICVFLDAADVHRMRFAFNMSSVNSTGTNGGTQPNNNSSAFSSPLPEALEKIMRLVNKLVEECNMLLTRAVPLLDSLTNCYQRALQLHEQVASDSENDSASLSQSGRKRIEQRLDNYRWNVGIVKAQADGLNAAKSECYEALEQLRSAFEQQEASASSCINVCRIANLSFSATGRSERASVESSRKSSRKASIVDRLRSSVGSSVPISRTLSRDVLF